MHTKTAKSKGISLMEVIIAVSLIAMIAAVLSPIFTGVNRAWDKDRRLKEMVQQARDAMDMMTYELKKSNGIIDGTTANLSTADVLDAYYVVFSSAGEEFYLDDKNSGYSTASGGTWNAGTKPGGFADDYDETSAGYATYSYTFATLLPGDYDVYAYYLPTAAVMNFNLFDDETLDYGTTYDQSNVRFTTTSLGASWDQLNRSNPTTRTVLNLTGVSVAIGVSKSSGSARGIADGFKFVYKGFRHKIFYYDTTGGNKITYGSDAFGFSGLVNNPTLLSNVTQIGSTSIFSYYQADGVTQATSPSNTALIKIAFQMNDPDGKVLPYELRGQVELKSTGSGSQNKIIINEIDYQPPTFTTFSDNFDGGGGVWATWNSWFDDMENGANGWTIETTAGTAWAQCTTNGTCDVAADDPDDLDTTAATAWGMGPAGDFAANTNASIYTPSISFPAVSGGRTIRLYFRYERKAGAGNTDAGDVLHINVSTTSACAAWAADSATLTMGGSDASWQSSGAIDLTASLSGNQRCVRFQFTSDADAKRGRLFIDSVSFLVSSSSNGNDPLNRIVTNSNVGAGYRLLWENGTPANGGPACRSSPNCPGTLRARNYPDAVDGSLISPVIGLHNLDQPFLEFYMWMNTETATGNFDGAIVQVSSSGDPGWSDTDPTSVVVWHQLGTTETPGTPATIDSGTALTSDTEDLVQDYDDALSCEAAPGNNTLCYSTGGTVRQTWNGDRTSWTKVRAKLFPNFIGGANPKIRVRFRFGSDRTVNDPGVFIDDVRVYDAPKVAYEWLELYNPNNYTVDVSNWRIRTNTSYGDAPTTYDVISGDERYDNATTIAPYGYAVVTTDSTAAGCSTIVDTVNDEYDFDFDNDADVDATDEDTNRRRLNIDDCRFGYDSTTTDGYTDSLTDKYGFVELQDNAGRVIDYVAYNTAFFDNLESYTAGVSATDYLRVWTTNTFAPDDTDWYICDPNAASGTTLDQTLGQYGNTTGKAFCTKNASSGEGFGNREQAALMFPPINLNAVSSSQNPKLSFYYLFRKSANQNSDDGFLIQSSQTAGTNFVQCVANDTTGLLTTELSPGYDKTIAQAGGSCDCANPAAAHECQQIYSVEKTSYTRVEGDLSSFAGSVFSLRFYFAAEAAGNNCCIYLDDLAVYYNWGGNGTGTLERKYWTGDSNLAENWAQSTNTTAPNIGTPNVQNTRTP